MPSPNNKPLGSARLRWRIDYRDKPSKYGVWNEKSPHKTDKISAVNLRDFVQVSIESENMTTREKKTLVSLASWDFVTMQIEAYSRVSRMGKQVPCFAGLSLVSSQQKVTVWTNEVVSVRDLKADERQRMFNISRV